MNFKKTIIRSEKHRRFIASLPCVVSLAQGETQVAHIRKCGGAGMGLKPCDSRCIPLSWKEHAKQHSMGCEEKYWKDRGGIENAVLLAENLYKNTGNEEKCLELIKKFKLGINLH